MPSTIDPFDVALTELDFDTAETLIASRPEPLRTALEERLAVRRKAAMTSAHELNERITRQGLDSDYLGLLDINSNSTDQQLLSLLPTAARARAELHIRNALRWEEAQYRANRRRLTDAKSALDSMDLRLAKGLMLRVDGQFLDTADQDLRDNLLLEISGRAMELEELTAAAESAFAEQRPQRRKWWGRSK